LTADALLKQAGAGAMRRPFSFAGEGLRGHV